MNGNKRKNNFTTTTTIHGYPAPQKIHHQDLRVDSQNIFVPPKVCEIYSRNYSTSGISNKFGQGRINLESAIQTSDYNVNFRVSMMVLWAASVTYNTKRFSTYRKEINKYNSFLRDLLEYLMGFCILQLIVISIMIQSLTLF